MDNHQAGHMPGQAVELDWASQVVPMPPSPQAVDQPPKYLLLLSGSAQHEIELPSRNTFGRLSRHRPKLVGQSSLLLMVRWFDTRYLDGSGTTAARRTRRGNKAHRLPQPARRAPVSDQPTRAGR